MSSSNRSKLVVYLEPVEHRHRSIKQPIDPESFCPIVSLAYYFIVVETYLGFMTSPRAAAELFFIFAFVQSVSLYLQLVLTIAPFVGQLTRNAQRPKKIAVYHSCFV